jgi:hypothetical protein
MTRPSFQHIAYTCTRMTKTLNVSVFGAGRGEESLPFWQGTTRRPRPEFPPESAGYRPLPRFGCIEAMPIAR